MNKLLALLICVSTMYHMSYGQGSPSFIQIADGLTRPLAIVNAGDQSDRLFIAEQAGVIKVITDPSTMQVEPTPFLSIPSQVDDAQNEQGLLGVVFDPDYVTNGYFYVNYIVNGSPDKTRISRFQVDSTNPDIANPNSEFIILEYNQLAWNHNGGDLHFGPDGYLYIASGDGGSSNDPQGNGQNTSSLLGAILRIDVHPANASMSYSIPATNPFNNEIWLYGLRNPWRFSFDSATDEMYIADVGQNAREEVNVIPAGVGGLNLGWVCKEGFLNTFVGCTGNFHDPIYDYDRSNGRSITGGYVYRGNTFSNFEGWYFFADFVTDQLWQTKGTTAAGLQVVQQSIPNANRISSFGQSESGELYALSLNSGRVYRIIDTDVCPLTLTLPTVSNAAYTAQQEITSTAVLASNSSLTYGAQSIQLNSNFSVPSTTTFETLLGICGSR